MSLDTYQEVTDRIVSALEAGEVPWRRPWRSEVGQPRSIDGRAYRGINALLLGMSEYGDPRWGTFAGIKRHGGKVRKGERSTLVVLWKPLRVKDKESGEPRQILMLKYFRVFNIEQCDGLALDALPEFVPDMTAEEVYTNYPAPPSLSHGASGAWYMPAPDHVDMPRREAFESPRAYYTTLFHELTHSTGHTSRLNRPEIMERNGFGSEPYSREELVAEIGAGMLAAAVGIEPDYPQSAAYLKSWLTALKSDRKLIVSAAARAQKAADHILNRTAPTEKED